MNTRIDWSLRPATLILHLEVVGRKWAEKMEIIVDRGIQNNSPLIREGTIYFLSAVVDGLQSSLLSIKKAAASDPSSRVRQAAKELIDYVEYL